MVYGLILSWVLEKLLSNQLIGGRIPSKPVVHGKMQVYQKNDSYFSETLGKMQNIQQNVLSFTEHTEKNARYEVYPDSSFLWVYFESIGGTSSFILL